MTRLDRIKYFMGIIYLIIPTLRQRSPARTHQAHTVVTLTVIFFPFPIKYESALEEYISPFNVLKLPHRCINLVLWHVGDLK